MRAGHRRAHLLLWLLMAVALPSLLIGALLLRGAGPAEEAPRRLAPP